MSDVPFKNPGWAGNTGEFDLTIWTPGRGWQFIPGLPCGDADFNRLSWLGFTANADWSDSIFLDEFELFTTLNTDDRYVLRSCCPDGSPY